MITYMKNNSLLVLFLINIFFLIVGCKNSAKEDTLKVKYVGYEMSDLPHYLFEDSKKKNMILV